MERLRRTDRSSRKVQTDPVVRYFLWGVAAALVLVALVLIRQVVSDLSLGGVLIGLVLLLVLLGSAYVLASLSLQTIDVLRDRLVVARWLFRDPQTVYYARITSVEQGVVGPVDVLNLYQMAETAPFRLLDLYRPEDIALIMEAIDASRAPATTDPEILRRAQSLREGRPGGPPSAGG